MVLVRVRKGLVSVLDFSTDDQGITEVDMSTT